MELVLCIRSFLGKDIEYLPKEIAVLELNEGLIGHWIFKPPYAFAELPESVKAHNIYCTQRKQIEWCEGSASVEEVYPILKDLFQKCKTVHIINFNARKFVEQLVGCGTVHFTFWMYYNFLRDYIINMCPLHRKRHQKYSLRSICALNRVYQVKESIIYDRKIREWVQKKKDMQTRAVENKVTNDL